MGEAARRPSFVVPVRCIYCGAEQDPPPAAAEGRCVQCARPLMAAKAAGGASPSGSPAPERSPAHVPVLPWMTEAMNDLLAAGPPNETPQAVSEVLEVEKRGTSYIALIPFFGPWLLRRSDVHTREEKRNLSAVSIAITLVLLGAVWMSLPTAADRLAALRQRIDAELQTLAEVAEQHRASRGAYPEAATWRRLAERADPRFFDPWARPYVYRPSSEGVTLGTLGRDGTPGGSGEDADASRSFAKR